MSHSDWTKPVKIANEQNDQGLLLL